MYALICKFSVTDFELKGNFVGIAKCRTAKDAWYTSIASILKLEEVIIFVIEVWTAGSRFFLRFTVCKARCSHNDIEYEAVKSPGYFMATNRFELGWIYVWPGYQNYFCYGEKINAFVGGFFFKLKCFVILFLSTFVGNCFMQQPGAVNFFHHNMSF